MVFGWVRRGPAQERPATEDAAITAGVANSSGNKNNNIARLAALSGADEVMWAPLNPDSSAPNRHQKRAPQPFKVTTHDVKAHLQDHSTAVVNMRTVVADAPLGLVFDLLADPHQHAHIFDAIESSRAELVSEEGSVRRWRLDYRARWKFWKVGGVCDNRLWLTTDREAGTVSFMLREPGFLRRYEGTWTITGPDGKGPGAIPSGGIPPCAAAAKPEASASPVVDAGRRLSLSDSPQSFSDAGDASTRAAAAFGDAHDTVRLSLSSSSSRSSSNGSSGNGSSSRRGSSESCSGGSVGSASSGGGSGTEARSAPQSSKRRITSDGMGGSGGGLAGMLPAINNLFMAAPAPQVASPVSAAASASTGGPVAMQHTPTTIMVRKAISPRVSPPFPVNQVLKGHACGQVKDMLEGLLVATARKLSERDAGGEGGGEGGASAGRASAEGLAGGRA